MTSIDELITDYQNWIADNDLPALSADELAAAVDLTPEQQFYVNRFIGRWAAVTQSAEVMQESKL